MAGPQLPRCIAFPHTVAARNDFPCACVSPIPFSPLPGKLPRRGRLATTHTFVGDVSPGLASLGHAEWWRRNMGVRPVYSRVKRDATFRLYCPEASR